MVRRSKICHAASVITGVRDTIHAACRLRSKSHTYSARIGVRNTAWKAVKLASTKASAATAYRPGTNSATEVIQNARNGKSDSNEFPLITNAGIAMNSSVAQNGCGEKRRAKVHMAAAAISEKTT